MRLATTFAGTILAMCLLGSCSGGGNIAAQVTGPLICQQLNNSLTQQALALAIQHTMVGQATPADLATIMTSAASLRVMAGQAGEPLKSRLTDAATAAEGVGDGQVTPGDTQAVADAFTRLGEEVGKTCNPPVR